jgi:hypothetical protein
VVPSSAQLSPRVVVFTGWDELDWEWVERARRTYVPLECAKLVLDAVEPVADILVRVRTYLGVEA